MPCSRLSFPVVFPVVTAPRWRASNTATRRPARASSTAVIKPVIPAPMIRSSNLAPGANSSLAGKSLRSSHTDVIAPPKVVSLYGDRPTCDRGQHLPACGRIKASNVHLLLRRPPRRIRVAIDLGRRAMQTLIIVIIIIVVVLAIIAALVLPRMRRQANERRQVQARDHRQEAARLSAQAESAQAAADERAAAARRERAEAERRAADNQRDAEQSLAEAERQRAEAQRLEDKANKLESRVRDRSDDEPVARRADTGVGNDERLETSQDRPGPYDSGADVTDTRQDRPGPYESGTDIRDDSRPGARRDEDVTAQDEAVRDDPGLGDRRDEP